MSSTIFEFSGLQQVQQRRISPGKGPEPPAGQTNQDPGLWIHSQPAPGKTGREDRIAGKGPALKRKRGRRFWRSRRFRRAGVRLHLRRKKDPAPAHRARGPAAGSERKGRKRLRRTREQRRGARGWRKARRRNRPPGQEPAYGSFPRAER